MYNLSRLTIGEMTECGRTLRALGAGARSMEETANRIVRFLYDNVAGDGDGRPGCVLVRCFKTHPYGELEPALQEVASRAMPADEPASPTMPCLTLLATAGLQPGWNSRRESAGHQTIPLPSPRAVARIPMIAQLIRQLGVEVGAVIQPDPAVIVDMQQTTFNVFHVLEALGSPHIPAQQAFVVPYGVRSVLGFGGVLPQGDLFAVVLFAAVPISAPTAELFKPLALSAKLAILPFANGPVFHD